jgi:hypothetical protein
MIRDVVDRFQDISLTQVQYNRLAIVLLVSVLIVGFSGSRLRLRNL